MYLFSWAHVMNIWPCSRTNRSDNWIVIYLQLNKQIQLKTWLTVMFIVVVINIDLSSWSDRTDRHVDKPSNDIDRIEYNDNVHVQLLVHKQVGSLYSITNRHHFLFLLLFMLSNRSNRRRLHHHIELLTTNRHMASTYVSIHLWYAWWLSRSLVVHCTNVSRFRCHKSMLTHNTTQARLQDNSIVDLV
jgi:hypothetical protein